MNRRNFLKNAAAAATGLAAMRALADEPRRTVMDKASLAPPCGLYCGICGDHVNGECDGCGCRCGRCAGDAHAKSCDIAKCAKGKGLETCAQCQDLPCTRVIVFTCDAVWRTHAPCIENLRRQQKIGVPAWLKEQEAYWSDEAKRKRWRALHQECSDRAKTFGR
jgi:hypothetical protein